MGLVLAIGALILFDVLAVIYGADSRDLDTVGGYLRPFRREPARGKVVPSEPVLPAFPAVVTRRPARVGSG